jgi:chromosome segregation ATPase
LPAWQALIESRLQTKDYDGGLEDAEALARLLRNSSTTWSSPHDRTDAAHWLGRMIAACLVAEIEPSQAPPPEFLDVLFRRFFDDELESAYDEGQRAVAGEYREELVKLNRLRLDIEQRQKEEQERVQAEFRSRDRQIASESKTVSRTQKEWNTWLDEQLERIEGDLEQVEQDHKILQPALVSLTASLSQVQVEISRLKSELTALNLQRSATIFDTQLTPLESQAAQFQTQYVELSSQLQALVVKAGNLATQRQAAMQRYQAATGSLDKRDANLSLQSKKLAQLRKDQVEDAERLAPAVRGQMQRIRRISTYLYLNAEQEKTRLLDELAQAG